MGEISLLYEQLNHINDLIHAALGKFIVLCVGLFSLYAGFNIYSWYLLWANPVQFDNKYNAISFNIMVLFLFLFIFSLCVYLNNCIIIECKNLQKLVNQAIINENDSQSNATISLICFSNQIANRFPYADCVLISLNYSIIFPILSQLLNYLTISIQFDNPDLFKNNLH